MGDSHPEYADLKIFTINGRIGRLRYLAWTLVLTVAMLVAAGILRTVGFAIATASPTIAIIVGSLLGLALFVAVVVVSVQIGVQRLHDLGWSGWLYLLNLRAAGKQHFPAVAAGSAR